MQLANSNGVGNFYHYLSLFIRCYRAPSEAIGWHPTSSSGIRLHRTAFGCIRLHRSTSDSIGRHLTRMPSDTIESHHSDLVPSKIAGELGIENFRFLEIWQEQCAILNYRFGDAFAYLCVILLVLWVLLVLLLLIFLKLVCAH